MSGLHGLRSLLIVASIAVLSGCSSVRTVECNRFTNSCTDSSSMQIDKGVRDFLGDNWLFVLSVTPLTVWGIWELVEWLKGDKTTQKSSAGTEASSGGTSITHTARDVLDRAEASGFPVVQSSSTKSSSRVCQCDGRYRARAAGDAFCRLCGGAVPAPPKNQTTRRCTCGRHTICPTAGHLPPGTRVCVDCGDDLNPRA